MSFTNETTHYHLPQWIGSDKPTYLVDQNNAYQTIDAEIYNANTTAGTAQTAAEGAVATAGAASSTAADALSAAQTASSTADNALTEAQTANTNAQAAQTAAGAAQTAAQAAQEAAAGNSITNLAPAYDSTITYAVDDLVTAEGKLYKCIVAVTSPEQFDINKWDDVTTSEVYARSNQSFNAYLITDVHNVSSIAVSTDTFRNWLNALYASVDSYLSTLDPDLYYSVSACRITGQECKSVSSGIEKVTQRSNLEQNITMILRLSGVYYTYRFDIRASNSSAYLIDMSNGSSSDKSAVNVGDTPQIRFILTIYKKI